MARSILDDGILAAFAFFIVRRKAEFISGSLPPSRAAKVISLDTCVNTTPRLASAAPFLRLMVDHLLCPEIKPFI
jgi:hypothetical protein